MARTRKCAAVSVGPARTTAVRDACRMRVRSVFLTRGGRPRRNAWWRAWVARLLPMAGGVPAPMVTSAALQVTTGILTIEFDRALDGSGLTAPPDRFVLGDGVDTVACASYIDLVGAVLRVQVDLPPAVPVELWLSYVQGPGEVVGMGGGVMPVFSGVPVFMA